MANIVFEHFFFLGGGGGGGGGMNYSLLGPTLLKTVDFTLLAPIAYFPHNVVTTIGHFSPVFEILLFIFLLRTSDFLEIRSLDHRNNVNWLQKWHVVTPNVVEFQRC